MKHTLRFVNVTLGELGELGEMHHWRLVSVTLGEQGELGECPTRDLKTSHHDTVLLEPSSNSIGLTGIEKQYQ